MPEKTGKEKRIHYLMMSGFTDDTPLGKTYDDLEVGGFVEINGRTYVVAEDSGDSRKYHEVYLHGNLEFDVTYFADRDPEWSKRIADFLKNPEKFEVKKVTLIKG